MSPPAPAPIPLGRIEQELSRQMRALGGDDEAPVQRVRMSNLVIYCDDEGRAREVEARIPDVVAAHPARVLLLVGDPAGPDAPVTATVSVRSHRLGRDQQACSEQVTLRAGGAGVETLPFAARSLVVGDLPTNLLWEADEPPGVAGALLHHLAEDAQQVLYDSVGWRDPVQGVATTAAWREHVESAGPGRRRVASDLNWRRLKYWRRLVSQALDPASAPGTAGSIHAVLVEHGPHAMVRAWLLVAWLARSFGWTLQGGRTQDGVESGWDFAGPAGEVRVRLKRLADGPPRLQLVRFDGKLGGRPAALNLLRESEERLAITLEGVPGEPRTVTVPPLTPAEVVGRQLSDRDRDPVFGASMAVARDMAKALIHH